MTYISSIDILFPPVASPLTVYTGAGNVVTGTTIEAGASTITVQKPANVAAGELLCVAVSWKTGTIANTVGGLTKLLEQAQNYDYGTTAFYYKVSTGSETNLTFTTTSGSGFSVTAFRVAGQNATPIDDSDSSTGTSASTTSYAEANALTTTNDGSVVINISAAGSPEESGTTWSTIPDTTISNIPGGANGISMQAVSWAAGPSPAGSYSPPAFVISAARYHHAISVAIKP